jgi:hypothetical protein
LATPDLIVSSPFGLLPLCQQTTNRLISAAIGRHLTLLWPGEQCPTEFAERFFSCGSRSGQLLSITLTPVYREETTELHRFDELPECFSIFGGFSGERGIER